MMLFMQLTPGATSMSSSLWAFVGAVGDEYKVTHQLTPDTSMAHGAMFDMVSDIGVGVGVCF
jgi:hypothetical protein